ncbi:peptide ABC transporter substrate-binding protein [Streptococcus cuniculi]|uniref:Peptide ABC transporter substrate-binding protein n=1 Tax=Streptococcus cuniculi TaxID=1432788 RepID=A0A4Y9J896_9STRE|nr:peptide ABC transporter substrate-binding protein [Streptococcus cuniculi]MBF0779050.1 peptide ABC transporter substrate-binding protein [Streptococcus cuniculi]TFU97017.1 peptide ABC transporter substrate-binding protein [Streptococcus cuniculi]
MKTKKWLVTAGVLVSTGVLLTACGGGSSTASEESVYSYVYATDPDTLDYTVTNRASTSEVTSNLVDGLFENDQYGNLVPSLAEDWTVSKDGLTYTYKLRKDAKWFTSEGEEYADVKAQDFVTGLKHAIDSKSEALYIVEDSIKGLKDYAEGKTNDFSSVGVKAIDDYTVEYTLNAPESYWNSKTTMGILFPVNEEFLKSKGSDFGAAKADSILSNGPYLLKSWVAKSSMEYAKNPNYYDKDNVHIDTVKLAFFDGSDLESLARNFKDGAYTGAALYPTTTSYPAIEEEFKDNIIVSQQDATTYFMNFNLDRKSYKYTSKKDDAQKTATNEAILNKNFRQAIKFALDKAGMNAQMNGEKLANTTLRNTLVPPSFVSIGDKTYGDVVTEKLVTYGTEWADINLADATNAYYNPTKAKEKIAKAKSELEAKGVKFPIHIDLLVIETDKNDVARKSSIKQSIEASLGVENVVIDLQNKSEDDVNNATYFATTAAQKDYDFAISGWGPDFQDPSTYLDILNTDNGGMLQNIGLEPGEANPKIQAVGLDTYTEMLKEANKEQDVKVRYEKYAEADAWLQDSALIIPTISKGGRPQLTKVVPFSSPTSDVGTKGDATIFKYKKVQKDIVTTKDYEAAREKWLKEKAESNAKYQEDLAKHVK